MKLSALHGNTLRVYLALIEMRNAQGVCPLSHRALTATMGLSRNTVLQGLRQLEQQGLILRKEDGWRPATRPLVGLLAPEGGSEDEPLVHGGGSEDEPPDLKTDEGGSGIEPPGSEDEPPEPRNGSRIEPLAPEGVQELNPPAPASTRTRTLWSSSYEEDSICTAVPPLPEGGLGGTKSGKKNVKGEKDPNHREDLSGKKSPIESQDANGRTTQSQECSPTGTETPGNRDRVEAIPQDAYQRAMQALWQQIAPGHPEHPTSWFQDLRRAFGSQVPVAAFQQFADQGKTLADLVHPDRYQRYLRACCRTAQQAPPPLRKPVRSTRYRQPPTDDDYNQDLTALYQARRNRHDPAYDEDLAALHRARRDPSRTHSSHSRQTPDRAERIPA